MASFAQVNTNNIVINVIALDDSLELTGVEYLTENFPHDGTWVQTSRNTHAGIHVNGKIPLRKNYAGIGYSWDEGRDAFYAPKPFDSWVLDEATCQWNSPVPYPNDEKVYLWDEGSLGWVEVIS